MFICRTVRQQTREREKTCTRGEGKLKTSEVKFKNELAEAKKNNTQKKLSMTT